MAGQIGAGLSREKVARSLRREHILTRYRKAWADRRVLALPFDDGRKALEPYVLDRIR
jgi:hypothetical protein